METVTNSPICRTQICKRPLTYLEKQKCWRCLVCNPIPKDVPKPKEEKKYLDVKITEEQASEMIEAKLAGQVEIGEERIREIVRDELENWYIQKPPVTQTETKEITTTEALGLPSSEVRMEPTDWRQQAKELGIPLYHRKKEDVLAEIEAKKTV